MKQYRLHILFRLIVSLLIGCGYFPAGRLSGQRIRVVPQEVFVSDDSLRVRISMDLNEVHADGGTAVIFTPVLRGRDGRWLTLPPVIVSGARRARQDRREAFLSGAKDKPLPYMIIRDGKRAVSKTVDYRIAVPYTSWMPHSSLLLRQEIKECCEPEWLGTDTLCHHLAISNVPVATKVTPTESRMARTAPEADTYASMVSHLLPDPGMAGKRLAGNAILYFDYPLGKDDVYPDYKNNRTEIEKIDRLLRPLLDNRFLSVSRISVRGYSSPDGPYGDNERLAKARSASFANYMRNNYDIPRDLIEVSSVAEDWEGFADLIRQAAPPYKEATLSIIRAYGIFKGREKQLMELQGGVPYKDMLQRFFPKLRRIEVDVRYDARRSAGGEVTDLVYTHPELLGLDEMYEVARLYRPGTDQYREVYEVAAFHFPDDVVANVNAASAVMLMGDLRSAWDYLRKVESDPRAWNNMGVLTLMEGDPEGAAAWFRKAVGVEPVKARDNLRIASGIIGK